MDKMEEFNKVIDNAIEKLNALRNETKFKKGEVVWVSEYGSDWFIEFFIKIDGNRFITTQSTSGEGDSWKYCKKFDEIEIEF